MTWANAKEWGWRGVWAFTLAWLLALTFFVVVILNGVANVDVTPLRDDKTVVPTTGEQGYPVHEFCEDAATTVKRLLLPPVDSTYAASYSLDRVKGGVHEVIQVNVYADPGEQPQATHYDSANVPADAFTSKDAMDCILKKAK